MAKIKIEKQDSVKIYKIKRLLDELSQKSGRGTELITVYIPKGKQLHDVIGALQQEQGTADNIKSDVTRTHVVNSLGRVVQRLKLYKKTPERGLAVFCGALPPVGGCPLGSEVIQGMGDRSAQGSQPVSVQVATTTFMSTYSRAC